MRRKLLWAFIILFLLLSLYEVVFRTRTVTYFGENQNWSVKINSKLVGLNGSYNIEIKYKGKGSVHYIDFNIHPRYGGGSAESIKNGYYYEECNDCGYYDRDAALLFFIVWKEKNNSEEKMEFIQLMKAPN